jgi:tetratricopeptide (TPR) repeat protein
VPAGLTGASHLYAENLRAGRDINISAIPPLVLEKLVALEKLVVEVGAGIRKEGLSDSERAQLNAQIERLSAEIQVRKPAVENFLRILGEKQVPIEALSSKLAEIAQRHLELLDRWSVLEEEDDPAIRQCTDAAKAAIDAGDYDRADTLLAEAEEMDLVAARQARELEEQAKQAADRRFLSAAAKRAGRGELSLARLDYLGAARHFKAAAEMVPAGEELVLADYLMWESSALGDAGKYWNAEKSVERSLGIWEKALGPDHPHVATSLNDLAALYHAQGCHSEAEPLYQRSLAIWEKALGPDHPDVAASLNNLALLYRAQGRYAEAEPLYQRSLVIREKALGPNHPDVAASLNNLALLYYGQGEYEKAAAPFERIIAIDEKALGPDYPSLALHMENYSAVLTKLGRDQEAAQWAAKAQAIRARQAHGE